LGYKFKRITEEYIADVLDIYNYYVLNTTCTFHAIELNHSEMSELVIFEDERFGTFIILDDNDELCGYTFIGHYKKRAAYNTTGEISIYLKRDYTGKGIGSAALEHIESYSAANGFHTLVATICSENANSIKLFEKNGYDKCAYFMEIGKKFGRWLDIVGYQKIISQ
jgi:L-amino acid N-acyltransferase YncA